MQFSPGELQIIKWALENYKKHLGEYWDNDPYYQEILDKVKSEKVG